MPPRDAAEQFDVAVLGTHLAPALLAAVLARHGMRVVLVDTEPGRDDVAGETTVPYTAEVFFTIAHRFDLPEVAAFGLTSGLPERVRRTSGIKRSLGFLHHRPGRAHDPEHAVQFNVPGEHAEWHPYRPDVDAHAVAIARARGAVVPEGRQAVADVAFDADGADVVLRDGARVRARYVVDAAGAGSPVVDRFDLEDREPRLRTRSRVLATHMAGVTPFEDTVRMAEYRSATPWSKGTLTHLFPGGWVQVAHFDNGADPVTALASVVVGVDPDRYADLPADAEQAFRALVDRFPGLRRCFADAVARRPWTAERRWQRTVRTTLGDRWFLLDRTASRNDLLLSREVTMGVEVVHALAPALIAAARADDWSPRRFRPVADLQDQLIAFNDRLLAAARTATADFRLWNAYSRVWLLWSMLSALSLKAARNRCIVTGGWDAVDQRGDGPFWFALPRGAPTLFDSALDVIAEVDAGTSTPAAAAARLYALLRRAPFVPPVYRFADPRARYYHFSLARRLRMLAWSRTIAPREFRTMMTRENVTSTQPAPLH